MKFEIQNRRDTFLSVELTGKRITIPARGTVGPFAEAQMSDELKRKQAKGDIVIYPIEEPAPKSAPAPETTKKISKAEDK